MELDMKYQQLVHQIESEQYAASSFSDVAVGDTVRVGIRIREGNKERIQSYQGTVIACKSRGLRTSFTVRRVFQGVGIERTILPHSPRTASIEILARTKTRRSKLYYLRERAGKSARLPLRTLTDTPRGCRLIFSLQ